MISSYLELQLNIIAQLSYKLILCNTSQFPLNSFFCAGESLPPQKVLPSKHAKIYSMGTTGECYKPENKRKCTEAEMKRLKSDLM